MMTTLDEICFYRASDKPYGAFSNLYRREIEFEGEIYLTSEHAYQAGKPRKPEVRAWLMAAPSPALLAMAAHGLYYWDITPDWSPRAWRPRPPVRMTQRSRGSCAR